MTSEMQTLVKKGCVCPDHHEFFAVILVDRNGNEVEIIEQSL